MGFLTDKVIDNRNVIREKKGLQPLGAEVPSPQKKLEPPSIVFPSLPLPERTTAALTAEEKDWQQTMLVLTPLEPVYRWGDETQPGLALDLAKQEEACLEAATSKFSKEYYRRLKQGYLKTVGYICERYWLANQKDPWLDVFSFSLGMKTIRIYPQVNSPIESGTPPAFFACEIPALLTTPPEELLRIYTTKEVFPGSVITYAIE